MAERAQREANLSYLVFPSTVLNLLPNHFTVFRLVPLAVGRTLFVHELYGAPAGNPAAEAYYRSLEPGYEQLLEEDLENLPWIQRGVGDSSLGELRLSRYERRIRHFRQRVSHWIGTCG